MPNETQDGTFPILFLDIDDVLCLNKTYGGYDVIHAINGVHEAPDDVFRDVFNASARSVLEAVHTGMGGALRYVISSTWREVFDLEQMRRVFTLGGLAFVADSLHEAWSTPTAFERGMRADDIAAWLDEFHRGEAFAIVDDTFSGPSLKSALARPTHPFHGRVVLCDEGVGLLSAHVETLLAALRRPANAPDGAQVPSQKEESTMNQPSEPDDDLPLDVSQRLIGPGVWLTTPVSQRPRIELQRWRVMELPDGDRHFVGWNAMEGEGRVSSKIVSFDAATGQGTTATGRVYQLQGPVGFDRDALHVWGSWIVMHGVEGAMDVSQEVQALIDTAAGRGAPEPTNKKGGVPE